MLRRSRIAIIAATATLGVAGVGVGGVAQASTMQHWSSSKCSSYKKNYLKLIKHPKKSQKAAANKVLKSHGCSVKI